MSIENKYYKDKHFSDSVTQTKVSHGKIETAIRVREAKSKEELDSELQRLNLLKEIDNSTIGEELRLPKELWSWQQLILLVGSLNLKDSSEIILAGKRLGYFGSLTQDAVQSILFHFRYRDYFCYDGEKGWQLTNKGQNEFSRLKQFL